MVLLAAAPPAAMVSPVTGQCLAFLSIMPGTFGALGLANLRAQREHAKAHQRMMDKKVRGYLHAKEVKAR
jgi:hypothetical protein